MRRTKRMLISPWYWLLNTAMLSFTCAALLGRNWSFWVAEPMMLSCLCTSVIMFLRPFKPEPPNLLQKFEDDLRKCEPAEANWLRLHYKATFGEGWDRPLHPHAQTVVESLSPPKKLEAAPSRSLADMGAEVRMLVATAEAALKRKPNAKDIRHIDTLVGRADKLRRDMSSLELALSERATKKTKILSRASDDWYYEANIICGCGDCDQCWDSNFPPLLL